MKYTTLTVFLVAASVVAVVPFANPKAGAVENQASKRYIVTFDKPVDEKKKNALQQKGARFVKDLSLVQGVVVAVADEAEAKDLAQVEGVNRVEVDAIVKTTETFPKETPEVLPWGVDRIDAEKVWSKSQGRNIKVAVIDTGIDRFHSDISSNLGGGISFVQDVYGNYTTSAYNDYNGHGTHVAGTIAAVDNTIGVIGVAPKTKVYAVKSLSNDGSGYISDVIKGIEWSISNRMHVINMSLGVGVHIQAFEEAIMKANAANITVVAAAGNDGDGNPLTNEVLYPAKYNTVLAVGATDSADYLAYFSADGEEVDIVAPGLNILSVAASAGYVTMSGTSMAAPHAAGTIAALLATSITTQADTNGNRKWDVSEIHAHLQATADDLGEPGRDVFYGHGLLDAGEAVTGVQTN